MGISPRAQIPKLSQRKKVNCLESPNFLIQMYVFILMTIYLKSLFGDLKEKKNTRLFSVPILCIMDVGIWIH